MSLLSPRRARALCVPAALGLLLACGSNDGGRSDSSSDAGGPESCEQANLQSDPLNCGVCGRDCAGGACSGGTCDPAVLAEVEAAVQWLVPTPRGLVVVRDVDAFVPLLLLPTAGGEPTELNLEQKSSPYQRPVVVGDELYALHDACRASRVPLDPSRPATLLNITGDECYELAGNSTRAFVADGDQAYLWSIDRAGDKPSLVFAGEDFDQIYRLIADDEFVYFGGSGLRRVSAGGGTPTSIVSPDDIAWISDLVGVDEQHIYYDAYVPRESMADYEIHRSSKAGLNAAVETVGVISIEVGEEGLAIHGFRDDSIYLSIRRYEREETVMYRMDKNSGARIELISGDISDFAVDEVANYWAEHTGEGHTRIWIQVR